MACALGSSASPAGVSSIRRANRSNSTDARPCSSLAICSDKDDWATPTSSAALVKLPSRATAQKHSSCRRSNFLLFSSIGKADYHYSLNRVDRYEAGPLFLRSGTTQERGVDE